MRVSVPTRISSAPPLALSSFRTGHEHCACLSDEERVGAARKDGGRTVERPAVARISWATKEVR
jgi:hypothetical protein